MRTIRDYVRTRIIEAARRQPDSSCLLSLLAATSLSEDELLDEGVVLGITGYEPVGEGLVWAMWLIAQHPEVQAKIREEAVDFALLRYTWAVLQEALRLYTPTWIFVRYATATATFPAAKRSLLGPKSTCAHGSSIAIRVSATTPSASVRNVFWATPTSRVRRLPTSHSGPGREYVSAGISPKSKQTLIWRPSFGISR